MAILKSIKQKSKEYIFEVFGNNISENPAKCIFNRFPLKGEVFPIGSQQSILDSSFIKEFDNTQKSKEKLVEIVINTIINNITAQLIDYPKFAESCIDHFEDLIYEDKEIKTVKDFLTLPQEAVEMILQDCYKYAMINDEFSIEQKKKLK